MVIWLRTSADYWVEIGDKEAARQSLLQGLTLAKRVTSESAALRSELSRRIQRLDAPDRTALPQLLENERMLERRANADWVAKIKSAEALSDAYVALGDWAHAVEWARIAYDRIQSVAGGPTVELALI